MQCNIRPLAPEVLKNSVVPYVMVFVSVAAGLEADSIATEMPLRLQQSPCRLHVPIVKRQFVIIPRPSKSVQHFHWRLPLILYTEAHQTALDRHLRAGVSYLPLITSFLHRILNRLT